MTKWVRNLLLPILALLLVSCTAPATSQPVALSTIAPTAAPTATSQTALQTLPEIHIVRYPAPIDFTGYYMDIDSIPKYDPGMGEQGKVELRSRYLTKIDATESLADLMCTIFDSKTQWPPADKMPAGFDPQKIMELGKDPGSGIRNLHAQGLTGKGIGIAIVDQPLLVDHQEYKDHLRLYEE